MTVGRVARKNSRRMAWWGLVFLLPSLCGCLVFVLAPFAEAVRQSFFDRFRGGFAGLSFYQEIFSTPSFMQACMNTLRFIVLCVPVLLALGLMLALLLQKSLAGRGALRAVFLVPMAIPVASVALLWQVLFHRSGIINALFQAVGWAQVDFMKTEWAMLCLVISYLWKNIGYTMVLWLAGLSGIPEALYEAASVDGATARQKFLNITLPCLRPTLFTLEVLSLLNAFKSYREAYLVAGNYPHSSIYLLQHIMNNWFSALEIEKLSAAAVVTALVILALTLLLSRAWAAAPGRDA